MNVFSDGSHRHQRRIFAVLIACLALAPAGCNTPALLQPDADAQPINIANPDGLSTREIIYRGWDHCFRVSDGSVEMIFVPSVGRLLRFAPVQPGVEAPTSASALTNSAIVDDKNLCWVNPKWTGINPVAIEDPATLRPRDYRLYGGIRHWPGPQEKWPTTRAPDLRKLIDVDVFWPPDPGADLIPFKYLGGDAGRVRFESVGTSATGLRAGVSVEVMAANRGVIDFHYTQKNTAKQPVEASSWVSMPLRQRGFLALRRDQLAAQPDLWPAGTQFADPWAILPLDSRPDRDFEVAIAPLPDVTGHVVVLHEQSIYSLQVLRAAEGAYPPGRSAMTIKRGVIGCPPQLELSDPECDEHYEIAGCSPLVTLNPGEMVDLKLRLVSKSVTDFDLEKLKAYLTEAVANETLAALPAPKVSGQTHSGHRPGPGPSSESPTGPGTNPSRTPDETYEFPPPLPDPNESPSPRPPALVPGPRSNTPAEPPKPPPVGPVNG